MNILFAVSEALPFIKTGGLADVAGALPSALAARGHHIYLFLPFYRELKNLPQLKEETEVTLYLGEHEHRARIFRQTSADTGVECFFIAADEFFDRPYPYGPPGGEYEDNGRRFIFFCRALLAAVDKLELEVDVFHAHDWQTALLPVYLKTIYRGNQRFSGGSLLTIHNLAYQGVFAKQLMPESGLSWEEFTFTRLEYYDQLNFLKGGLVYADCLNTVSPSYSREILQPEFGCGLEEVLKTRSDSLHGILNGVDYREWDPEHDPYIANHFRPGRMEGKKKCREKLARTFALENRYPKRPLVGMVSRLAEQKGFDLILPLLEEADRFAADFIFIGSGERKIEDRLQEISQSSRGQIAFHSGYDNQLAHLLEAGSDIFLMPSRYEPCGLNQMYSLRYGTLPLVRAVGGLNDCVTHFDQPGGNGFKFSDYSPEALAACLQEALEIFQQPRLWQRLRAEGMKADFSWTNSAADYEEIYRKITRGN